MNGTQTYAGFWLRVLATIIDTMLLMGVVFVLLMPIVSVTAMAGRGHSPVGGMILLVYVVPIFFGWLYSALMESSAWQATLGKRAMGLQVTNQQGQRISFGQATGRHFAKILSAMILYVGFLMVAFTERKQGLHDIVASTLVIKKS